MTGLAPGKWGDGRSRWSVCSVLGRKFYRNDCGPGETPHPERLEWAALEHRRQHITYAPVRIHSASPRFFFWLDHRPVLVFRSDPTPGAPPFKWPCHRSKFLGYGSPLRSGGAPGTTRSMGPVRSVPRKCKIEAPYRRHTAARRPCGPEQALAEQLNAPRSIAAGALSDSVSEVNFSRHRRPRDATTVWPAEPSVRRYKVRHQTVSQHTMGRQRRAFAIIMHFGASRLGQSIRSPFRDHHARAPESPAAPGRYRCVSGNIRHPSSNPILPP